MIWIIYLLLAIGLLFQALGSIALHRFPDVYTRLHGATKCTTFGSLFIYLAIMAYALMPLLGGEAANVQLLFHTAAVLVFILLTNPTGAHALARAAHRSGIMPKMAVVDKLEEARK